MHALLAPMLMLLFASTDPVVPPQPPSPEMIPEMIIVGHGPEAPDVPPRSNPTFLVPLVLLVPYATVAPEGRACVVATVPPAAPPAAPIAGSLMAFPADRASGIGSLYPPPVASLDPVAAGCRPFPARSRAPSR